MKNFTMSIEVGNTLVAGTMRTISASSKSEAIQEYKELMDSESPNEYFWAKFPKSTGGIDKVYLWS